jgi:hypothetical protein
MPASQAAVILETDEVDPLQLLRTQLVDMRRTLVQHLAAEFDGGNMALLSSVAGAIAGVDAEFDRSAHAEIAAERARGS